MMSLTGEQLRAARALVRLEQAGLATAAGVSVETIKRLEGSTGEVSANSTTLTKVRRALEAAGVIFIDANGEGPGVRLRKQS